MTRHEIFTGLSLISSTNQVNDGVWLNLIPLLKGIDIRTGRPFPPIVKIFSDGIQSTPIQISRFQFIKEKAIKSSEGSLKLCKKINHVLKKVDSTFLDHGIKHFNVEISDIASDVSNTTSVLLDENPRIKGVRKEKGLNNIVSRYKTHIPKLKYRVVMKNLSKEFKYLYILDDLLDAMSYELKNRNSHTGELTKMTVDEIKTLIGQRIKVSKIYLQYLSGTETELPRAVLGSTERSLYNANSYTKLKTMGKYIDSNTTKLIMVRRWWAL
jgi:hypothetical protein